MAVFYPINGAVVKGQNYKNKLQIFAGGSEEG